MYVLIDYRTIFIYRMIPRGSLRKDLLLAIDLRKTFLKNFSLFESISFIVISNMQMRTQLMVGQLRMGHNGSPGEKWATHFFSKIIGNFDNQETFDVFDENLNFAETESRAETKTPILPKQSRFETKTFS